MSIALFNPYTSKNPESGLLFLFARHLSLQGATVEQIKCNGVVATCDRDSEHSWRRPVRQCFDCMHEQDSFTQWSGIASVKLSQFMDPDLIQKSARWMNSISDEDLATATYQGLDIQHLVRGTFKHRFEISEPDPQNKLHNRFHRILLLSGVRMNAAMITFANTKQPEMIFAPVSDSFVHSAMKSGAAAAKIPVITFAAQLEQKSVQILNDSTGAVHECPLLIEDLLALRNDSKTWSPELLRLLGEAQQFLSLNQTAVAQPIAG